VTPSIFYFKTRRKVELFGIVDEGTRIQCNFLVDEPFKTLKDPNSVISMVHHYLMTQVPEGCTLIVYCDNSPGQNKN